jgi:hypothetical protein
MLFPRSQRIAQLIDGHTPVAKDGVQNLADGAELMMRSAIR